MAYRIALDEGRTTSDSEQSDQQLQGDLLLAQVHALFNTSWFNTIGAVVMAVTFWAGYLIYTGDRRVLLWAVMVHGTQAGRWLAARCYHVDERGWQRMEIWRNRLMLTLVMSALAWGSAPLFVLPTDDLAMICLTMLALLGMGSGGIGPIVAYRPAILAWLLPLLLPLPILLFWYAAPLHQALALFALAFMAVTLVFAFGQNELLVKALKAQFDNAELVAQLRHQMTLAAEADREKSRFVASASHDLRQPMHALGLFASALEKRLSGTSEAPLVGNLNRCIESLDRSFNAMLDISKLDAGVVEPQLQSFPIRDVFRRLHMHFAGQAEGAGLALRFKPGGKHVTSDPQLLERILSASSNPGDVVLADSAHDEAFLAPRLARNMADAFEVCEAACTEFGTQRREARVVFLGGQRRRARIARGQIDGRIVGADPVGDGLRRHRADAQR